MKAKTLRGQLTRAALLTTLLAVLLSAAALLGYESYIYRAAWVTGLQAQAEIVSRSTEAALVFNDPKVARETLAALRAQPRFRAASIYNLRGDRIASYVSGADEQVPGRIADAWLGPRFTGGTLELASPIEHDGERVGMLYLRVQHDIWARLASYAVILVAVCTASLALASYVFGRLQRRVTTPLDQMTEIAREVIASRNWTLQAPATEYEDVGVLVRAFNGMLTECGLRTSELEREMQVRKSAEEELRQADQRKDTFLATLAHELRNPLAPMTNAVALIQAPSVAAAAKGRAVAILERQLRQMVRLIDDLLDASRIATGKLSLNRQTVNLTALVQSAVELAQHAAREKGLRLSLELPAQTVYVDGDEVRLGQVMTNLLNNACRYTGAGGEVKVTLSSSGGVAETAIVDTGIGVDTAMQDRIFELFEQADKSLERGNSGLGIGLTLARQLARLHGGDVAMTSDGLGRGSSFTLLLPILRAVAAAPVPAGEPAVSDSKALRILLADDNVDLTESFAMLLRDFGHVVEVVEDGEAAVRAASHAPPDIAFLDIGMPKLNGFEVARQFRADVATRGVWLVAITGWGQASYRQASKEAGFDRHLVKPVDPDDVLKVIEELSEIGASRKAIGGTPEGARRGRDGASAD